jgi:phospholipase/lecithinase/hemolysin
MNDKEIEKLIEKYEAGVSTLSEEQFLFTNTEHPDRNIAAWAAFVKANKKKAPANFNEFMWDAIQIRKNKQRRFTIGLISAAATVILLFTIPIYKIVNEKRSYKEKEILLSEAYSMFNDAEQIQSKQNIIYEDELIIIYTASE